jgi:hypothetical protein
MARGHPKKAPPSSDNESNDDDSLFSTNSEPVLLSPSDKSAIIITRFIRFCRKREGECWYMREYPGRKGLANAKDSQVREFYRAVDKAASNILRACFPYECARLKAAIEEMFGQSAHSEINKLRREYEQKVTAPIQESLQTFDFHTTMNALNMKLFMQVRFALICVGA